MTADSRHTDRPADRPLRTRWSEVWPFVAVALVGVAVLPFGWNQTSPYVVGSFVGLTLLTLVMVAVSVQLHRRNWLATAAPLMVFVDLALARYAAGPTVASGISPLVLLPVLWIALKGTRTELIVAGVLSAAFYWLPAAFIGPPAYPVGDWYRGLLVASISLLVVPVIQRVVRDLATASVQERRASQQAAAVTSRWRTLLEQLPDTVVTAVEVRDEELTGLETLGGSEELKQLFAAIILTRHRDAMQALFGRGVDGRAETELSDEVTGRTLEVVAVPVSRAATAETLETLETLVVIRDVTEDRERERALDRSRRQLAYLAEHDPVSGLLNRRRFDELLADHLARSDSGAVLMLDLDLFKQVNDRLGHAAGDRLIIRVAGILQDELRDAGEAARLGGDEFAALLPDADTATARRVAGRLVRRVRESVTGLGEDYPPVSASIGVVTLCAARSHGVDPLALADLMLYQAKADGRGRYAVFDEEEAELPPAARAARWQDRIRRAMEDDRLVLQLQPIMRLADDRVVGAEALVRLSENGRLVPPAEFIEIAERSTLITEIDSAIVRRAAAVAAEVRRRAGDFRLAVNVSARSVGEPVLEQAVLESLAEHDLPGSALVLEVTETAALTELDRAQAFAERMHQIGCALSLDDFGSGFGSFTRLKRLTFDYVKIYGEFVADALESEVDCSVMRSIIRVAHDIGKEVVAEHVSDEQTLDLVRREGADLAQGFYVGRPMPTDEFVQRFVVEPGHQPARVE